MRIPRSRDVSRNFGLYGNNNMKNFIFTSQNVKTILIYLD